MISISRDDEAALESAMSFEKVGIAL